VKIQIHARMPLTEAAEAQRRLEARQTSGATVLLPVAKEVFEKRCN